MPENCVSKLNSHTGLGLYVGSSPQRQCPNDKNPLQNDILVDPGKMCYTL